MKKTLLAAALVTGFAGVAHAESSVTLYGIVDGGYGYQQTETKFKGADVDKITNKNFGAKSGIQNGSRWGLKGSEDLGNGTSAIFVLESGFSVGDGTMGQSKSVTRTVRVTDINGTPVTGDVTFSDKQDRLFGRQAYVGLTNDSWGTITIGRQYNLGDTFVASIDPFGTGWGYAGAENIFGNSVSHRYDGMIKYMSPSFSGFQFGIGAFHETDDYEEKFAGNRFEDELSQSGVTLGLSYTGGPLYVGANFDYERSKNTLKINGVKDPNSSYDDKTKAWNIGMTYDFDVVKLHALYGGQKDGLIGNNLGLAGEGFGPAAADLVGDGLTQHSWLVGLSAPVGDAGKVMFSYAGNTIKNDDLHPGFEPKAKSHNFALGYRHGLSKRTSVYGVASYGWSDYELNDGSGFEADTKATQVIIGLQHRF